MKFLVLGGAGYVGSAFVYRAIDAGHAAIVYDSLERGHAEAVPKDADFIMGNILDVGHLSRVLTMHKPDAVLHYAAYALVPESVVRPGLYYKNNVGGVISLFEAFETSGHRCPLVFSSTCAVFGTPETSPIIEEGPKKPVSPYGASKLMAEQVIADCAKALQMPAVALRYFNACGADLKARTGELHEPETHLIPNVLAAALADHPVTIYGRDYATDDGTCVRDYIHVTDLADAHLAAVDAMLATKTWGFEAINLGTGQGYSNLQIVDTASRCLNKKIAVNFADRRPGDAAKLFADPRKAKALLGFNPQYSDLDTIVKSALAWLEKVQKTKS